MELRTVRTESIGSVDSGPTRSAPLPVQWTVWGRPVKERGCLDAVPDLLSEDFDEDTERFLYLPPVEDCSCSPSRNKRSLSNDNEQTDGSPTNRRRTQELKYVHYVETVEQGLQDEVMQWLRENLGWDSTDVDSQIRQQERMLEAWNEEASSCESWFVSCDAPPPVALKRQDCIKRGNVHPEILRREAALFEDNQEKHSLAFYMSKDSKEKSKPRFETHGQVELYPGKQVKIHGKDRAYASLRNGDATIFQCVGCDKRLLANQGTKLLYCTDCGTLTPTEIRGEVKDSDLFEEM